MHATAETPPACTLSIVTPVFNERANLQPFLDEVGAALDSLPLDLGYEIVFADDGSSDGSGEELDRLAAARPGIITVIHLARNFGMEAAIQAALQHVRGEAVIILDADLQDDPAAFPEFLQKWREGYEVVYAVRTSRQEGVLRKMLFWTFYRMLGWLANIPLPADASNFALMDRRVVLLLCAMPERNRFLRGLRAWVGFRQAGVPVARRARYQGKTRLGLRGQWKLAMNAIFAFSYVPLFVFRLAGAVSLLFSVAVVFWALYYKFVLGGQVHSWASLLITMSFLGGINLFGLGIIGEYVARIHDEVRGRPNYVIHHITGR